MTSPPRIPYSLPLTPEERQALVTQITTAVGETDPDTAAFVRLNLLRGMKDEDLITMAAEAHKFRRSKMN